MHTYIYHCNICVLFYHRYGRPRAASVVAVTNGSLWCLDKNVFARLILNCSTTMQDITRVLRSVRLFKCFNLLQLHALIAAMEVRTYKAGEVIVRGGETSRFFHVIISGTCIACRNGEDVEMRMEHGSFFLEQNLIDDVSTLCDFTLKVETNSIVYLIDKAAMERSIGCLADIEDSYNRARAISLENIYIPMAINDYTICGSISQDDSVSLSQGRINSDIASVTIRSYVLKKIEEKWLTRGIINTFEATRIIAQSPNTEGALPLLLNSYHTPNALHLVYSTVIVCDLVSLMRVCGAMGSEPSTYIAVCVISAIEALHSLNIVYRAIQPECLYLDTMGRVVLMDYDLCKIGGVGGKSFTICGAYDYLSPEQISQEGHNEGVDFWQLGILLFEITAGEHPFAAAGQHMDKVFATITSFMTKQKGNKSPLIFPESISAKMKSLILQLLVGRSQHRLGMSSSDEGSKTKGMTALKQHALFQKVDWSNINSFITNSPLAPFCELEELDVSAKTVSEELAKEWELSANNIYLVESDEAEINEAILEKKNGLANGREQQVKTLYKFYSFQRLIKE